MSEMQVRQHLLESVLNVSLGRVRCLVDGFGDRETSEGMLHCYQCKKTGQCQCDPAGQSRHDHLAPRQPERDPHGKRGRYGSKNDERFREKLHN